MGQLVLVVEDEETIAQTVAYALQREGFETRVALDGEAAIEMAEELHPVLVLLDLMLPGLSGLEVCRTLRRTSNVPIIMVTARTAELDRVVGLELGADDYIGKPFSLRELVARVRAVLRRAAMATPPPSEPQFSDGWLTVDLERPYIRAGGRETGLSPRELSLLRALLTHRGRVRTREQLLDEAWGGDEFITVRTVDVHVRWLRQKLEPDPEHPQYIETVRGLGYRFGR